MTFAKDNGILEQFPLLAEVSEENTVLASGGEWYLLVPMEEGVSFTVSESVLLRGNVSDIYPSFMVTITGPDGAVINYAPGLSLRMER